MKNSARIIKRKKKRQTFIWQHINRGYGWNADWLKPADLQAKPDYRISTRWVNLDKREWHMSRLPLLSTSDSNTLERRREREEQRNAILQRDDIRAYYGVVYPVGGIVDEVRD